MLLLSVFSLVIVLDAYGCLVQPLLYLWLRQWRLLPRGKCLVAQKFREIFRSKVYFVYFAKYTLVSENCDPNCRQVPQLETNTRGMATVWQQQVQPFP